jgi:uncharacterized membrane protein YbhN (UPF0104 family)
VHLSFVVANVLCAGLVALDLLARTWRIQALARGLGYRPAFARVFAFNVTSDASASLTPLRAGGEPVRFAGILHSGLSISDALALISVEAVMEYAVVLAFAGYVGSAYGLTWWSAARARLVPAAHRIAPWIGLTLILGVALWAILRRIAPRFFAGVHGTLRTSLRNARRIAPWAVAISVPLTVLHVIARLAILPVLTLAVPGSPAMGPVWVGSFALLYGQLFLPTPAGAGAVDVGFLNGASGYIGPNATELLIAWRFYTTVTGIILGVIFGVPYYGETIRRWLLRRQRERNTLQHDAGS